MIMESPLIYTFYIISIPFLEFGIKCPISDDGHFDLEDTGRGQQFKCSYRPWSDLQSLLKFSFSVIQREYHGPSRIIFPLDYLIKVLSLAFQFLRCLIGVSPLAFLEECQEILRKHLHFFGYINKFFAENVEQLLIKLLLFGGRRIPSYFLKWMLVVQIHFSNILQKWKSGESLVTRYQKILGRSKNGLGVNSEKYSVSKKIQDSWS